MKRSCPTPELVAKVTQHRDVEKLGFVEISRLVGLKYPVVVYAYRYGRKLSGHVAEPKVPPPSPELIAKVTQHRDVEQLSFAEIARLLKLKYPAVAQAYRCGRRKLRKR
jgi:hypothetical protein